jgi:DNA primase
MEVLSYFFFRKKSMQKSVSARWISSRFFSVATSKNAKLGYASNSCIFLTTPLGQKAKIQSDTESAVKAFKSVATPAEPRDSKGMTLRKHNCLRERSERVLCF